MQSELDALEQRFQTLNVTRVKPFLKWAGGKSQIIDTVLSNFPADIKTYYEPFIGGGSVLIEFLSLVEQNRLNVKKIYASDINPALVNCYKVIQNKVDALVEHMHLITSQYSSAPASTPKKGERIIVPETIDEAVSKGKPYVYYFYRNKYNTIRSNTKCDVECAALFIFLNKTCFRGLYREGRNGFNVPFGNYDVPQVLDVKNVTALSKLFNKYNVKFKVKKFQDALTKVKSGDFVYLDPPYYPEKTTSFVDYNAQGFTEQQHHDVIGTCKSLPCDFLLSNSNTDFIKDGMKDYNIKEIKCKRHINAKKPDTTTFEVLVSNRTIVLNTE